MAAGRAVAGDVPADERVHRAVGVGEDRPCGRRARPTRRGSRARPGPASRPSAAAGSGRRGRSRSSGRPGCRASRAARGRVRGARRSRWVLSSAGVRQSSRAKSSMPAHTSSRVVRSSLRVRCHSARWPMPGRDLEERVVLRGGGVHGAADVAAADDPVLVVRRRDGLQRHARASGPPARGTGSGRSGPGSVRSGAAPRATEIDVAPRHVGELTCQGACREVLPRVHGGTLRRRCGRDLRVAFSRDAGGRRGRGRRRRGHRRPARCP